MNERRIGVIYQWKKEVEDFRKRRVETLGDYARCLENSSNKMIIEYNYQREEGLLEYRQLFSFHYVGSMRDAHNLAGMQFNNYYFCGGHYEADVLNYLHSRIRG
jgi:hypothetical protein